MARLSAASALTLTTIFLAFSSCLCVDTSDRQLSDSILVQILGSKYTTFVKLLGNSDLLSDLESDDRFNAGVTIFATTDEFFADQVSPSLLQFLDQPENFPLLRKVLLNHIVPGKYGARSWYPGEVVTSLGGSEARFHLDAGSLKVNDATVKEFGVLESADGVVHALDGFLVPEDVEGDAEEYMPSSDAAEEERREMMQEVFNSAPPTSPPVVTPSPPVVTPSPPVVTGAAPAPAPTAAISTIGELLAQLDEFPGFIALINSNPAFADFLSALLQAGTPITILAPTDAAISAANLTGYDVFVVLQNHVVKGVHSYDMLLAMATSAPTSRRLLEDVMLTSYANNTLDVTKAADGTLEVNGVIVSKGVLDDSNVAAVQVEQVIAPYNAKISMPLPPPPSVAGGRFGVSALLLLASLTVGAALAV